MATLRLDPKNKTYRIDWEGNEPYNVVYLHIKPLKPMKRVYDGKLQLEDGNEIEPVRIYQSAGRNQVKKLMPNTTYEFSLRLEENGEMIDRRTEYWGSKERIQMAYQEGDGRMGRIKVTCPVQIPENMLWLMFRDDYVGLRFFLPPMTEEGDNFQTSCLVWKDVYEKLKLCLDDKISDYFDI